jgi:hypothetical protein
MEEAKSYDTVAVLKVVAGRKMPRRARPWWRIPIAKWKRK